MKIPNLKLKFQTSQITDFATPVIVDKILTKLRNKKYQIRAITFNSIAFGWNPFRLVWNFQAPYILDGGNFEITESEQGTLVVLNYFINILHLLIIMMVFITTIIIQGDYSGLLFFGIFFLVAGTFQYVITKNVGKDLLRDILAENY